MPAYDDNPNLTGDYVWIKAENTTGRNGPDRRSRASQVTAHKKRYERTHGVTLEKLTTSYSETCGFTHQTAIRYKIIRPANLPLNPPVIPDVPLNLPLKLVSIMPVKSTGRPVTRLNARQRRLLTRNGSRFANA